MHNDCSYGYKVTCCYDHKFSKTVQNYRDGKTVYTFIKKKKVLEEVHYCKEIMKNTFQKGTHHYKKIEVDFQTADRCHKCNKLYGGKHIRVKDKVLLIKNVILSLD